MEDEQDIRELLRSFLEGAGYEVLLAADGVEALGKIRLDPPDLVILDLMMPRMGGWAFLAASRELPRRPPVVVVSAVVTAGERAMEEGAAAFLIKPFRWGTLLEACKLALLREATCPG